MTIVKRFNMTHDFQRKKELESFSTFKESVSWEIAKVKTKSGLHHNSIPWAAKERQ